MAQRSHVPKFGDWESENVPYTTYFENARSGKDKGSSKMINPNDPEENPGAFRGRAPPSTPSRSTSSDKMTPVEKRKLREEGSRNRSSNMHRIQKSGSRMSTSSTATESGSSSDRALLHLNNHRMLHAQKGDGSNSFPPSSPHRVRGGTKGDGSNSFPPSSPRSGTHRSVDPQQPHKVASVPKFGAWDETDPTSGEGFTIIFNKVKQEKKAGGAGFPAARPELEIYSSGQRRAGKSPSGTKICCCFFSRSSK